MRLNLLVALSKSGTAMYQLLWLCIRGVLILGPVDYLYVTSILIIEVSTTYHTRL